MLIAIITKDDNVATNVTPTNWTRVNETDGNNEIYTEIWVYDNYATGFETTFSWGDDSEEYIGYGLILSNVEYLSLQTIMSKGDSSAPIGSPLTTIDNNSIMFYGVSADGGHLPHELTTPASSDNHIILDSRQTTSGGSGSVSNTIAYSRFNAGVTSDTPAWSIDAVDEWSTYSFLVSVQEATDGLNYYTLEIDSGTYSYTGTELSLVYPRTITLDSGSYTYTGTALDFSKGYKISVDSGNYTFIYLYWLRCYF